ncbi:alpha/beta hydrolase [Actinocrispum wychmicini]|uniref:Acetyl esterase/lipase n=1 Tax=Actinocrispum wychmicini TaxID=1213861 RepID=A0A4R2JD96_9PSEU|nr:alpha/beta hydrolase [Actinocrispum wychmicini]TCO56062.1 acetyl esterase/lipase [Actinocrispum wychmicini]
MPSIRARLLAAAVAALRVQKMFDGPERIRRSVAGDRRKGPAAPSAKVRERFSVREEEFSSCRVYTVAPRDGDSPARRVLYLHGGGWTMSITEPHWGLIAKLARRLDCAVTVPLFPLAPEHTARDTFAMLLPFYADLAAQGELTVMGDSSGGNLALSLAMQARSAGMPQPARIVLLSPAPDATFSNPELARLDHRDPILPARGLPELGRVYAGDLDVRDPVVSPLFGMLTGLPPTAIFTGTRDILNADAHRLREKATRAGVPVAWHEYPDMLHVWPLFPIPEATHALEQIAAFITTAPTTSHS